MLSQPVVQLVTQPPAFTIRHSRDFLIKPSALSHLAFERCRPFFDAVIQFLNECSQLRQHGGKKHVGDESCYSVPETETGDSRCKIRECPYQDAHDDYRDSQPEA